MNGPDDFSQLVGDDIQITCMISGIPSPKVTWCQGQKTLRADKRYRMESTAESATLAVAKATLQDAAQYTLKLRNDAGSDHFSVTVNVEGEFKVKMVFTKVNYGYVELQGQTVSGNQG